MRSPSLIPKISVWIAKSAMTSLLNWSKIFPLWFLKMPPIPHLKGSAEKDLLTLILINPKEGGFWKILWDEQWRWVHKQELDLNRFQKSTEYYSPKCSSTTKSNETWKARDKVMDQRFLHRKWSCSNRTK